LEAVGDILIFVDDDVRIPPNFIEKHLQNYLEDPELHGVAGQTLQEGQVPTDVLPEKFYWPHVGWMFLPLHYAKRARVINWPSCNGSIRREVALAVGGFDEQFVRTWWDDSDFSWRLYQWGAKIVFDPSASLVHLLVTNGGNRPHGQGELVRLDAEYWATLLYFWRKNFGLLRVWRHLWWWLSHRIFCTRLLVRPYWLLVSFRCLLKGYLLASRQLKKGPIYISKHDEKSRTAAGVAI
jgi:GT2 family glycosyltransferase